MRYLYVRKEINEKTPMRLTPYGDMQTWRKLITLTNPNKHKTTKIFTSQVVLQKDVHAVKNNSN